MMETITVALGVLCGISIAFWWEMRRLRKLPEVYTKEVHGLCVVMIKEGRKAMVRNAYRNNKVEQDAETRKAIERFCGR